MKRKLMPRESAAFYILIPSSKEEASPCPDLDLGDPEKNMILPGVKLLKVATWLPSRAAATFWSRPPWLQPPMFNSHGVMIGYGA